MAINRRVRGVLIAGVSLAVIAAVGIGVAFARPTTQTRYVTATAATGDVTQTFTGTGTIARTNTATASFAVEGTVSSVKVAVGDRVEAGAVLAVLKKGPLQLAVLDAETSVAEAKATLYSAQHPSSSSSRTSSGSGSGSGGRSVTIDPTALVQATGAISKAVAAERLACAPVFGQTPEPTPTTSPSASASPTADPSPSPTPSESPTTSPTATVRDQSDVIEANDPTQAEMKACGAARAQVTLATANLQTVVQRLLEPGSKPSGGSSSGSTKTASAGGSTTTPTVSAAQVASARAKLLQAEQSLQTSQDALEHAELIAPIAGTVGTLEVAKGDSSGSASVVIVGAGNAQVTLQLPLKTRTLVKSGQQVTVTPAGSTRALSGTVTAISVVETSGTAGATPTYATVVTVADPGVLLASGAKASVTIPVASATGVVRVPASAVTPTGTGTATVQVVSAGSATATSVEVRTGAVGGGWVQIVDGITAGQTVVLADNTAELPTNTTNRRTSNTTRATASASAQPDGGSTSQPSAAPSATPSR